jgi:pyruvyltransferase
MKTLKAWYCLCGPRERNFGDKLTKILIEHLTDYRVELVPRADRERCQMIGIGSILHVCHPYSTGNIWTTGFMHEYNRRRLTSANVIAVRGKLSLSKIKVSKKDNIVLGDGGLLCNTLVTRNPLKKYKLGIIPHYKDQDIPIVQELIKDSQVKFIDICADHMDVINETIQCEYVLSSSLHGVILADSLSVPNDWIVLSNNVSGKGFKFQDYYSVFNIINKKPFRIRAKDDVLAIIKKLEAVEYKRPNIKKIQSRLLKSLSRIK